MLDCRACGACCATSADWPRFTLEDDAAIDRIPAALRDDDRGAMRCDGDRCAGLAGAIGQEVSCLVYADRPDVCRACEPGDDACTIARHAFGFAA